MKIFVLILSVFMVGCVTPNFHSYGPPVPPAPKVKGYTRQPVIKRIDTPYGVDFQVSDELLKRHLQYEDYVKRIAKWQEDNLVP